MKLYKLRHKKSGLFWQPDRGSGNVSKRGKIYQRKPNLDHVTGTTVRITSIYRKELSKRDKELVEIFGIDVESREKRWYNKFYTGCKKEDWEIIEIAEI